MKPTLPITCMPLSLHFSGLTMRRQSGVLRTVLPPYIATSTARNHFCTSTRRSLPVSAIHRLRFTRICRQPDEPSRQELAEQVTSYIPATFTSIQQISRNIPAELMEQICHPRCGGLRLLLSHCVDRFEMKQIGVVTAARYRGPVKECMPSPLHQSRVTDASLSSRERSRDLAGMSSEQSALPALSTVTELSLLFPTFLVPVKAIWSTVAEADGAAAMRSRVLDVLRQHHRSKWLTFRPHPAHCSLSISQLSPEAQAEVFEHGYVKMQHSLTVGDDDVAPAAPPPNWQWSEEFEVQEYEWYRVARVLPTVATGVPFTSELQHQATLLLPPGRDVWHVLWSAPHLFELHVDVPEGGKTEGQQGSSATSFVASSAPLAGPPPSPSTGVVVQYKLEDRFVPAGMATANEDTLLRELEQIAADRDGGRCGLTTRQRRRKRMLQRQLAYLRNPTPYFDERVLAQHLFDLLPLRDGVHQSALLGMLPTLAVQAFPPNVTRLLKVRPDLFQLSDASHGVLVRRADAPEVAPRSVESVTGEEVLQHLFSAYSLRSDPRDGTTLSRSLPRLPKLVRDHLFSTCDAVAEVLSLFPDKVEVLPTALPSSPMRSSRTGKRAPTDEEHTLRELRTVRGRRDFLIPFRFVGEWQDRLVHRYETQQMKDARRRSRVTRGATGQRHDPSDHH